MNAWLALVALPGWLVVAAPLDDYESARRDSLQNERPLLVVVGTGWCPACRSQKDALARLQQDGSLESVNYVYVDADRQRQLADVLMRGRSIPQTLVFTHTADGWRRTQMTGFQSPERLRALLPAGQEAGDVAKK